MFYHENILAQQILIFYLFIWFIHLNTNLRNSFSICVVIATYSKAINILFNGTSQYLIKFYRNFVTMWIDGIAEKIIAHLSVIIPSQKLHLIKVDWSCISHERNRITSYDTICLNFPKGVSQFDIHNRDYLSLSEC